jgi:hypothetical protein
MAQYNTEESFLIESLWVLDKDSGVCLFEENYIDFMNEGMSIDLIGSFLSALLTFAGETFADEIQHVQFSNRKIIFEFSKHLLFIVAINAKSSLSDVQIKNKVDQIAMAFNRKYLHIFAQDQGWGGNITQFEPFTEDLKKIVKREPSTTKIAQLFDFKESIKKLDSFIDKQVNVALKHKEKLNLMFNSAIKKKKIKQIRKIEDQFNV